MVEVEHLEPLDFGEHHPFFDKAPQGRRQDRAIERHRRHVRALLLDDPDPRLGGELRERHGVRVHHGDDFIDELPFLRRGGGSDQGQEQEQPHGPSIVTSRSPSGQ